MAKHLYKGHFQDGTGRVINSGSVTVYLADTTTKATIYPARSSGDPAATADTDSVVASSSSGLFQFYVEDQDYTPQQKFDLSLTKTGYTSQTYHNIEIVPEESYRYWVDPTVSNQAAATTRGNRSLKDLLTTIGTSKHATIMYPHTGKNSYTGYNFSASLSLTAYSNIKHEFQQGAMASIDASMTVRHYSPSSIIASPRQQIFSGSGSASFSVAGTRYPEWWGIDGTADEVQINAAEASVAGGTVQLLDKTYNTAAAIALSSNVTLKGMGMALTKIIPAATMTNIIQTDTSASVVTLKDLWVYGTGTTNTTERGFYSDQGADIVVENCKFENMTYGIQCYTTTRAKIINNTFTGIDGASGVSEGYGVLCNTDCDHIQVNGNHFKTVARHAIYFSSGTSNSAAIGNAIDGVSEGAITIYATSAQNVCKNNQIIGNIIENVTSASTGNGHGIEVTDHCFNTIIQANTCDNIEDYGILIQSDSAGTNAAKMAIRTLIEGNIIENAEQGIRVSNAKHVQILDNKIYNISGKGIHVLHSGSAATSIVQNVFIDGNELDTVTLDGINIEGGSSHTNVSLGINKLSNITETEIVQTAGVAGFQNTLGPVWREDVMTYSDFSSVSATPDHDFNYVIPNGCIITGVWWNLDTEFSGGSVSAATLELGVSGGDLDGFFPAENVFTGAGVGRKDSAVTSWGALLYDSGNNQTLQHFCTANTTLKATLRLTADTGDNLTAGQVRIFVRYEQPILPTT